MPKGCWWSLKSIRKPTAAPTPRNNHRAEVQTDEPGKLAPARRNARIRTVKNTCRTFQIGHHRQFQSSMPPDNPDVGKIVAAPFISRHRQESQRILPWNRLRKAVKATAARREEGIW